jgi:TolB protein
MRYLIIILALIAFSCTKSDKTQIEGDARSSMDSLLLHPEEMKYLKNIKQLTFGGNNAEAYWSFDDNYLVFQSDYKEWGVDCDQIFVTDGKNND